MVEYLIGLIAILLGNASFKLANKQAKSEVISSLKNALRLTEKHISETRTGEFGEIGFSDVESRELSSAWSRVAATIRPFDDSFANTLEEKSDYWLNPDGFHQDIQDGTRRFNYKFRLLEVKTELNKIEKAGL